MVEPVYMEYNPWWEEGLASEGKIFRGISPSRGITGICFKPAAGIFANRG